MSVSSLNPFCMEFCAGLYNGGPSGGNWDMVTMRIVTQRCETDDFAMRSIYCQFTFHC